MTLLWIWLAGVTFYSLLCGVGGGMILDSKNRSWAQGFFLGFLFGFIGLIITVGLAPQQGVASRPRRSGFASEVQIEPMSLASKLSAIAVGVVGGIGVVVGVVELAAWLG
jgi:hypothetical protein